MNEKEMRELDAWIAENVMGWKPIENISGALLYSVGEKCSRNFHPTLLSQDAMTVLKKCADRLDCEDMRIGFCTGNWSIQTVYRENPGARGRIAIWALPPDTTTLELAICKFAKELFSK